MGARLAGQHFMSSPPDLQHRRGQRNHELGAELEESDGQQSDQFTSQATQVRRLDRSEGTKSCLAVRLHCLIGHNSYNCGRPISALRESCILLTLSSDALQPIPLHANIILLPHIVYYSEY